MMLTQKIKKKSALSNLRNFTWNWPHVKQLHHYAHLFLIFVLTKYVYVKDYNSLVLLQKKRKNILLLLTHSRKMQQRLTFVVNENINQART